MHQLSSFFNRIALLLLVTFLSCHLYADDIQSGEKQLVSVGHRNPQGLYYSQKYNDIFSTEHGPTGGDEFNIHFKPGVNNIKNFGWPISSYGEHGAKTAITDSDELKQRYTFAPLHKSHKKYGFVEPVKYYVPSIGITELEKIPREFIKESDNDFFMLE